MGIEARINNLRERIDNGDIDPADERVIAAFDERLTLLAQEYTDHRHEKLLRHVIIMAESDDLPGGVLSECLEEREAADTILGWINDGYSNEETNRDYRSALRVFARRVTDGDEIPDSVEHIPTGTSSDYDPTPDPREMLRWGEDIKPMIEATSYSRNAAMIALQFDAGLRGSEFKELCVGDIQDHKHGLQLTTDGAKKNRRTLLLIPSVTYISRWLEDHPNRDDPSAPLWSKLNTAEGISDRMIYDVFQNAAAEADVSRPITLTNFRKSSAAFLASRNLNQAHIEDHHGWVRGSDAAARYIAVFGSDTDRELARLHGKDIAEEDEPDEIAPIDCPTCEQPNDRDASFCSTCGQALDQQAAAEIEETEGSVREVLANLDPEDAQQLLKIADLLEESDVRESLTDR